MSRRLIIVACFLGLGLSALSATPAQAGWREFHYRTMLDWHRNNVWPQPWLHIDRLATCRIFDIQAQNGWAQQSTLTSSRCCRGSRMYAGGHDRPLRCGTGKELRVKVSLSLIHI